jgi:hypothetical protein
MSAKSSTHAVKALVFFADLSPKSVSKSFIIKTRVIR